MIWITPSSCAKDLTTISEGTGATFLFHSRVPMCFHALFLGTHTIKKDNGNPTINYFIFIYEWKRWTPVERLIHSDRHEGPTPLHCQNPCCIFEAVGLLASLMVQPSSRGAPFPLSPRSTETKCRTGANSSSRKKGLAEPGSLTNTKTKTIRLI